MADHSDDEGNDDADAHKPRRLEEDTVRYLTQLDLQLCKTPIHACLFVRSKWLSYCVTTQHFTNHVYDSLLMIEYHPTYPFATAAEDLDEETRTVLVENVLAEVKQRTASAACDRYAHYRTNRTIRLICVGY